MRNDNYCYLIKDISLTKYVKFGRQLYKHISLHNLSFTVYNFTQCGATTLQ